MIQDFKNAANLFYGESLGDLMYGFLQELCEKAFNNKVSVEVPIVMTTAQSAYNRFSGWYNSESHTIELVNHLCKSSEGGIVAKDNKEILLTLAHEFGLTSNKATHPISKINAISFNITIISVETLFAPDGQ